jgi:hypothetical protein
MDSLVLQTAIGLTFVFAVFAVAVSALTEVIARYLGLRAEYLLRGVRTLVDGESEFSLPWRELMPLLSGRRVDRRAQKQKQGPGQAQAQAQLQGQARVSQIMSHRLVASSATQAAPPPGAGNRPLTNAERRQLPSYISGRTFARALLDVLSRDPAVPHGPALPARLKQWASDKASHDPLAEALRPLLVGAEDNLQAFEARVAQWYDDHMARVSGWYKRHVRWVSLGIGLIVVVAFNLNAVRIAESLYSDQALRSSVVTEATRASSCGTKDPASCLGDLRAKVGQFQAAGLPVGWGEVPECATIRACSWMDRHGLSDINRNGTADLWAILLVLLGWALMIGALLPGARFWFDLLSRLGSLRSTGPKPVDLPPASA